jgi:hypothetical protein
MVTDSGPGQQSLNFSPTAMNLPPSTPISDKLAQDASWHLYQFDPAQQASHWLKLSEEQYRDASFLDQRLLQAQTGQPALASPEIISLQGLEDAHDRPSIRQTHFIFHIGHCGSTLLSRALAATANILPIREPLTLRQLASDLPVAENPMWSRMLQCALAAHSRSFHSGQLSMVKATSTCNALVRPILEQVPDARALLMYVPLESFLAGMLGKQSTPLDLRGHLNSRLHEWRRLAGSSFEQLSTNDLDDAQLTVLSWLTSMARLLQAQEAYPDRCRLLDFDQFLGAPEVGLEQLVDFFSLSDAQAEILQAWPEISTGYSKKPDEPYSAFNRNRTLSRGRMMRGDEIQSALQWAEQLARQHSAFSSCTKYFGQPAIQT